MDITHALQPIALPQFTETHWSRNPLWIEGSATSLRVCTASRTCVMR